MDDKPMEGNPQTGGEPEAKPTSSQPQGQPLEAGIADTIAQLQRKIDAQEGEIRALKSGKDKAVDRVVKSQEETLARLANYLGVDEAQVRKAQREAVLDDLISERMGGPQSGAAIQGRVEAHDASAEPRTMFTAADAIAQAEEFGVSVNDPKFIELLRDKSLSREKVRDFILEAKKPQKQANPADVVQAPSLGGAQSTDVEKLSAELNILYKNPSKPGAMTRITEIQEALKKAGT